MATKTSLAEDPPDVLRRRIVCHYWRKEGEPIDVELYSSYFHFYNQTCRSLLLGYSHTELDCLSITTHEELIEIADTIWDLSKSSPNYKRQKLREALMVRVPHSGQPSENINNSINLFLRLWCTVRIQKADFSPAAKTTQWDDDSGICDFFIDSFPEPRAHFVGSGIALESNFTAVNLYEMCGVCVEWTCQLEDHLRYDIEKRTVHIYSLSKCLQDHLECNSILPQSLVEETLLSLSILFPNWNMATEHYLRRFRHLQIHASQFEYPQYTHLDQFHHWRDRIARLNQEFQNPGPKFKHLWSDRRNRLQWYTFWFAVAILVMTVIFGVITTTLTAMQTLYSYQSLQIAREAALQVSQ